MKYIFVILTLFFCQVSQSQCRPIPYGTLLVAYICEDGILLSADSRGSWDKGLDSNDNRIVYAYSDSARKIMPLGYFQVMIAGKNSYKNEYIENVIATYNKKKRPDSLVETTFNRFKRYAIKRFKLSEKEFNETAFIIAGYENRTPTVFYSDSNGVFKSSDTGLRVYSKPIARKYYNTIYPLTCINQVPMIENMFAKCSEEDIEIGGPITIIKINTDNSTTEFKSFRFRKPYKDVIHQYKAILNNDMPIKYLYKWSREWLTDDIKCSLKCRKCL